MSVGYRTSFKTVYSILLGLIDTVSCVSLLFVKMYLLLLLLFKFQCL